MSHSDILIWLESSGQHGDTKFIDSIIAFKIPDKECEPELYEVILLFAMHGESSMLLACLRVRAQNSFLRLFMQISHHMRMDMLYERRNNER